MRTRPFPAVAYGVFESICCAEAAACCSHCLSEPLDMGAAWLHAIVKIDKIYNLSEQCAFVTADHATAACACLPQVGVNREAEIADPFVPRAMGLSDATARL